MSVAVYQSIATNCCTTPRWFVTPKEVKRERSECANVTCRFTVELASFVSMKSMKSTARETLHGDIVSIEELCERLKLVGSGKAIFDYAVVFGVQYECSCFFVRGDESIFPVSDVNRTSSLQG